MSIVGKNYKIKDIRYSCSAHTTEDVEKVKLALLNLIPEEIRNSTEITQIPITGHAGNEMFLLEFEISQNRAKELIFKYYAEKMQDFDKEYLFTEFENHYGDDNCFYFRFDKQEAYNERLVLEEKDNTINIAIKFVVYKQEPNLERTVLAEFGLLKSD